MALFLQVSKQRNAKLKLNAHLHLKFEVLPILGPFHVLKQHVKLQLFKQRLTSFYWRGGARRFREYLLGRLLLAGDGRVRANLFILRGAALHFCDVTLLVDQRATFSCAHVAWLSGSRLFLLLDFEGLLLLAGQKT